MLDKILHGWRRWRLSCATVSLGAKTCVGAGVVLKAQTGRITFGEACKIDPGVVVDSYGGTIDVGPHVFLGPYTVIYGHGGITIGEATLIAAHCRIVSSNHTVPPFGVHIRSLPDVLLPTKIGRDVWLGADVTVLGGVTIGDGCIVGAGAVVTKDLSAGAIATGVPAKVVSYREGSPAPADKTKDA